MNLTGRIVEYTYAVASIETTAAGFAALGVGPWYTIGPFRPPAGKYRGVTSTALVRFALAFSGDTLIELVQHHDDEPCIFQELIGDGPEGFHHWARFEVDFDAACAALTAKGIEATYTDKMADARIAIFDTRAQVPGMTEIIELTPTIRGLLDFIRKSADEWDGEQPLRPLPIPAQA
jgi:hypothetical protein